MDKVDPIIKQALVGTARASSFEWPDAVQKLLNEIKDISKEKEFLIGAGILATYRLAGKKPRAGIKPITEAPQESLSPCSPSFATIIEQMFNSQDPDIAALLPEALKQMQTCNVRLPDFLLPKALETKKEDLRQALIPVLGERGIWLSRFNKEWKWACGESLVDEVKDPQQVWDEGTFKERLAVFMHLRQDNPQQALKLLTEEWSKEKADHRLQFIEVFRENLSKKDTAFLTEVQNDRSYKVRFASTQLLVLLPDSEVAKRLVEEVNQYIEVKNKKPLKIEIDVPKQFLPQWEKNGFSEKPPGGGKKAWWQQQLLGFIPPKHWQKKLASTPQEITALFVKSTWQFSVLAGITQATLLFNDDNWKPVLWEWWYSYKGNNHYQISTRRNFLFELLEQMLQVDAEDVMSKAVQKSLAKTSEEWPGLLATLPTPWSSKFANLYLQELGNHIKNLNPRKKWYHDPWLESILSAATALPYDCLDAATQFTVVLKSDSSNIEKWLEHYESFVRKVKMRKQLIEEIKNG